MFELFVIILFVWLSVKFLGLAFKITWGLAKIIASLLFVAAVPALFGCLLFAGGLVLLAPIALILIAIGVLGNCA